jgi:hypothetical protein
LEIYNRAVCVLRKGHLSATRTALLHKDLMMQVSVAKPLKWIEPMAVQLRIKEHDLLQLLTHLCFLAADSTCHGTNWLQRRWTPETTPCKGELLLVHMRALQWEGCML